MLLGLALIEALGRRSVIEAQGRRAIRAEDLRENIQVIPHRCPRRNLVIDTELRHKQHRGATDRRHDHGRNVDERLR